ncbi:MAG: TM2 domain-containing protein [Candidatus Nomurabacteria bacterium]|jgi:TM2 domain-containing membrane protein YozV|nr:TM2 domain-containing protein [Candidatus Nomurabacteria bacterium]
MYPNQQQTQQSQLGVAKSSTTAGLLGIFLGSVGAHDFYLGYKKMGIIHVVLLVVSIILIIVSGALAVGAATNPYSYLDGSVGSKVSAGLVLGGIGWVVMAGNGLWGFVTGIMVFAKSGKYGRDANGTPLV